ncbi:MAG: hypothetical protein JXA22_04090 [Candidatus Thermoplasmatota archaeon]|nr:hypothetical protein [Candidatus Thermoplasmatota archaeon]
MIDVLKALYLVSLLGLLYYLTIRVFVKKEPFRKVEWAMTMIAISVSLVLYVRFMIHDLILLAPSDEASYVSLIEGFSNGVDPTISGPGFVYLIYLIHSISGWPVGNIVAVQGLLIGSALPMAMYLLYRSFGGSREEAAYSCLLLISTSYFLWPMIESRPQQLGLLLVLVCVYLYHAYLTKGRFKVLFVVLCYLTFIFHILSFLVLMGIIMMVWWFKYLDERADLKDVKWPVFVLLSSMTLFIVPFPPYLKMHEGVSWMISRSELDFILRPYVFVIFLILFITIIVGLTLYFKKIRMIEKVRELGKKHIRKIVPMIIGASIVALTVQFILNKDIYISKYKGSIVLFFLLQAGNIVFGGLFIRAYYRSMKDGQIDEPFFIITSSLMLIGVASLLLSIFLPHTFNNWVIRLINYWTIFAAPMIGRSLMDIQPRHRFLIALTLPIMIGIGLLNISRDQDLLGYP